MENLDVDILRQIMVNNIGMKKTKKILNEYRVILYFDRKLLENKRKDLIGLDKP